MKLSLIVLSTLLIGHAAIRSAEITDVPIPREGLALWLTADAAVVEKGEVVVIKDGSGKGNDATREKDPKLAVGNPTIVKHEVAGRPVIRFDGRFSGYEFSSIKNARTVFLVVSKNPAAFKKFNERFVLGGKEKTSVDYHVGCHWTDTLIELGKFAKGKAWFNGFPIDPTISEFAPKLAVISYISAGDTVAEQLARDREFLDRSWYGDIGELIIYTLPLTDGDRSQIENYLLKKYGIIPFQPVVVSRDSVLPGHTKPPTNNVAEKGQ